MANNPGDPEAASMEVSETKLVNFAEKTRFDVSSFPTPPDPTDLGGGFGNTLLDNHITIVPPRIESLMNADGTWDKSKIVFQYSYEDPDTHITTVHDTLAEISRLGTSDRLRLESRIGDFVALWEKHLDDFPPSDEISVFQLDPNQLLTVSDGFKILLRRPL